MKEKGTSFIELLLLMAMVTVLSAAAIAKLPSRDALVIDAEAAFFVSKLRYLQEISCTTQRMYMEFLPIEAESAASFSVQSHELRRSGGRRTYGTENNRRKSCRRYTGRHF